MTRLWKEKSAKILYQCHGESIFVAPVFELYTGQFHLDWFDSPGDHKNIPPFRVGYFYGGAEGNRTPVRKQLDKTFSERSLLFTFPHPGGNKHPTGLSSFMMHGMGKAYHTHGLHSDHTRARLVDLPGRMGA